MSHVSSSPFDIWVSADVSALKVPYGSGRRTGRAVECVLECVLGREHILHMKGTHSTHIEKTFYMAAGDSLTCGSAGFLLGCSIENTFFIENTFYMAV